MITQAFFEGYNDKLHHRPLTRYAYLWTAAYRADYMNGRATRAAETLRSTR